MQCDHVIQVMQVDHSIPDIQVYHVIQVFSYTVPLGLYNDYENNEH